MTHITYLIGAGASANSLPVVKGIEERLEGFINTLNQDSKKLEHDKTFSLPNDGNKTKQEWQTDLLDDLIWLKVHSEKHHSIDTFAKKLWIKDQNDELRKLKLCLTIFFIYEQLVNKVDERYDTFFAAILGKNFSFPQNMNVISWNYDLQFELAFQEYSDSRSITGVNNRLDIISKFSPNNEREIKNLGISKINGSCSKIYDYNDQLIFDFSTTLNMSYGKEWLEEIVKGYAVCKIDNDFYSSLSFAWEDDHPGSRILQNTQILTYLTEVMVVIGYSFPYFNREIDRKIIREMRHLRKVYFQAPARDLKGLIERFRAIRSDFSNETFIPIDNIDSFFLPDEL